MTGHELNAGRHGYDDVSIGDWLVTGSRTISAADIDAFARLSGDEFEVHMDKAAAVRHGFPDRIAHGLLILSLVDGLKNQAPARFNGQASLGWEWTFRAPVFIGDTITLRLEVADKRSVRDPERGILRLYGEVSNQHDKVVQKGWNMLMAYR